MEKERKLYPLTQAQDLIYYNLKYSIKPAVVNICTMMHFDGEIDPQLMMKAVKMGLLRNTAASTRIVKTEDKSIKQYFPENPTVEGFSLVDFSKKSQKAFDKYITKMNRTPFPNRSIDVQLYNVKLIKKPDGKYALYMCVNHLAFDAYSLMYTASDILAIYVALRDGKELPENKYDIVGAIEGVQKKYESEQKNIDLKYWHDEVFSTEPHFTSINGMDSKEWVKGKNYGKAVNLLRPKAKHINKTLKKETVDRMNSFAAENKISPKLFYLLAIRSFLGKKSGYIEDIMMLDVLMKRSTLKEKNAGGTFVQGMPARMNFSNSLSFIEACEKVKNIQYGTFMHAIPSTMDVIGTYESQYKKPPTCGYAFLNFTYQPYSVQAPESVPVHFSMLSNGYNALPLYLTVMPLDNSGDLNFNYDFNLAFANDETIEEMHSYILRFFDKVLDNPQITLRELMDI